MDATHPDDKAWSEEAFRDANARQGAFTLEYRLRGADGRYHWCIDAASPRIGADGEFRGYIGSVIDITDRKRIEEQLRAANETFRDLIDRSPFGVYAIDADFRLVQVSEGAQGCSKMFVR
ncbi:MAG: PAS domain-containing protein [Hyphomonadaceae bacterium JAD_PAG50586_4]|nr:MAG: PAS domain-containing protein [Hyphomonadaceae bacterium JAD_PAG50586_4]